MLRAVTLGKTTRDGQWIIHLLEHLLWYLLLAYGVEAAEFIIAE